MQIPKALQEIGFNKRQLNFADFEKVCAGEKIITLRTNENALGQGAFFYHRKRPCIWLHSNLQDYMLMWVAFHELTHFLLHPPDIQFFSEGTRLKIEHQANIIAACCVIPRPLLKQILLGIFENDFPRDLWQLRCEAVTRYGL